MTETDSPGDSSSTKRSQELTVRDFAENDLPQRPFRYRPEYRRDVRHFALICGSIAVFIAALSTFHLL